MPVMVNEDEAVSEESFSRQLSLPCSSEATNQDPGVTVMRRASPPAAGVVKTLFRADHQSGQMMFEELLAVLGK